MEGHNEFAAAAAHLSARINYDAAPGAGPMERVAEWNDADGRTPADVIAVFERAAREVA
ncbi:DUF6197 family protein [Streptomyces sp. NPDC002920]